MKIVILNTVPYGSTGKISKNIGLRAEETGDEVYYIYGWTKKKRKSNAPREVIATSFISKVSHMLLAKCFKDDGMHSRLSTGRLIHQLEKIKPDVLHLHIMHDYFLNIEQVFAFAKLKDIPIIWTFHDCWSFTGGCAYFSANKCDNWKKGCHDCRFGYAKQAERMWKIKQKCVSNANITVVTPSKWLKELTEQSMFKKYPVMVINNGIELNKFKPCDTDFKKRYNCDKKKIVLGVSLGWSERKGLDVFEKLSSILPDDYQIVLVGTNVEIDKVLPQNVISIHRTESQEKLAEIYSVADVFVNPTREDNFPTVNIESLACGTPVITFQTGGSGEIISNDCGIAVKSDDIEMLREKIISICENNVFSEENCINRAKEYAAYDRFSEYVDLYHKVGGKSSAK